VKKLANLLAFPNWGKVRGDRSHPGFDITKISDFESVLQKQGRSRYQVFAPLSRAIALPLKCPCVPMKIPLSTPVAAD
jgi:hypothetical protein